MVDEHQTGNAGHVEPVQIGVAIMMGGGPASMYAAHALDAIEQFASRPTAVE